MNIATKSNSMKPGSGLLAATLSSLVAVAMGAGCGEGLVEQEPLALRTASRGVDEVCTTGTCDNPTNGQGIYVSQGSGYCIRMRGEPNVFCPESFDNLAGGGMVLSGQRVYVDQGFPAQPHAIALKAGGWLDGQPVFVASVYAKEGGLIVTVRDDTKERSLSGGELESLEFEFPQEAPQFRLKLRLGSVDNGIQLYKADYALGGKNVWQPYCDDDVGLAAFLPGNRVHSVSARVTEAAETTTMACRTGAITTCMLWGYQPWTEEGAQRDEANILYGSCLQAKRAAYFVGSGDFKSYTVGGTPLAVQDKYEIMNAVMPGVEAVWSPDGAVCLSPRFRRIPPLGADPLPALPASHELPECDPALHSAASQGQLSKLLQTSAPLVTGPRNAQVSGQAAPPLQPGRVHTPSAGMD
ncbi:ADYC domain-containing protein [Cystobacter fuscus]|uniref:ADYC domain-containing protein n=1 Tax=Cystobacter fuscus TaxID=43 RepID=UPI002B2D038A|nr:hypothetical protein F0U63_29320 [Cystobacter fuscus]